MTKIGINGFGRIGRLILRALLENYKDKIQVVAINDLGSIETNAHLIKYDSTHGILNQDVKTTKDGFQIGDQNIKVFAERDPAKLSWGQIGVDVVLANEILSDRAKFYKEVYFNTDVICGDIRNTKIFKEIIQKSKKRKIDFIITTPPCQGMSTAGKKDKNDPRNNLITNAINLITKISIKFLNYQK